MKHFARPFHAVCALNLLLVALGQAQPPVTWQVRSEPLSVNEVKLFITAKLRPNWHIYSQHLREGGPMPTRFQFSPNNEVFFLGDVLEMGLPVKFCDDIYEMEITWYSEEVSFIQNVRVANAQTVIRGEIEYMTCDTQQCIPAHHRFEIPVDLSHKKP
jgi:DsbC/DsbD-like thiol-disulfide interchange protein